MRLISGCRYLKVNLKATMYICVNSTIQRCRNKIIKIFLTEDFFHLPPVAATPVVNLELWISPRIFIKIRNGSNGILRGLGKLIHEKNRSRKSRDTVSLKHYTIFVKYFLSNLFWTVSWESISTITVPWLKSLVFSRLYSCNVDLLIYQ